MFFVLSRFFAVVFAVILQSRATTPGTGTDGGSENAITFRLPYVPPWDADASWLFPIRERGLSQRSATPSYSGHLERTKLISAAAATARTVTFPHRELKSLPRAIGGNGEGERATQTTLTSWRCSLKRRFLLLLAGCFYNPCSPKRYGRCSLIYVAVPPPSSSMWRPPVACRLRRNLRGGIRGQAIR